jgi:hypothetical protein
VLDDMARGPTDIRKRCAKTPEQWHDGTPPRDPLSLRSILNRSAHASTARQPPASRVPQTYAASQAGSVALSTGQRPVFGRNAYFFDGNGLLP